MNRIDNIRLIRKKLNQGKVSIGSWIQIPNNLTAEILGDAGYDWVAIDQEHGAIASHQLPDLCRSIELGNTLPIVRIASGSSKECKSALDSGAGGIIIPMVETKSQLENIIQSCQWPPKGKRGVGFSRANYFGKYFERYKEEAANPLIIAMIENIEAINNIEEILLVKGLDAILIGPYDLSASLGKTGEIDSLEVTNMINLIIKKAIQHKISVGIHVVSPEIKELKKQIKNGLTFLPYSIDAVFLNRNCQCPNLINN